MLEATARFLGKFGISANIVTAVGLILSLGAAYWIGLGFFWIAGCLVALAGFCDLVDGKLARLYPTDHKFGALLDSSLDRYSDALYYGGFIYYFLQMGDLGFAVLGFSACVASFEVSYVRARSEGLGFPCDVGFWERGERTLVIILGLVFGNPHMAILLLGTLPHGTAVRRIFHSRRRMMMAARKEAANETPKKDRRSPISLALAALIFLAILFLRI